MNLAERVASRIATRDIVRADPITLEEFGYLLGQNDGNRSKSGITVSATRALGITAWWSGCRYLTESVSFLPVSTFRGKQTERTLRADPPWLEHPDVDTPWPALVEHWIMSLLHRGNAYAAKLRDGTGMVTGLRPIHPDRVEVGRASDGHKVFKVKNGDSEYLPMSTRELLHIPFMSYDGTCGLDPIRIHAQALGLAAAADEMAAKSYGQGNHLQAYISLPQALTTDQANELRIQWEALHNGMTSQSAFGVLGNGGEYKTVSLDPEQMQLIETRKYGVTEMARILRIPPHKLYDLERSTFSNIEHQAIEAVTDSIRPLCERVETWVNDDPDLTPPKNFIEFELEGLLRGDMPTRYASYGAAISAGWMAPITAARIENQPAPDILDYYTRPLNMAVLRDGMPDPADDPPPPPPVVVMPPDAPPDDTTAPPEDQPSEAA